MAKGKAERRGPGDRRREAMLEAALELFTKQGYDPVTLDDVIRKAGGSKSSIYEFFGGKEGLFFAIIEESSKRILTGLELPDTTGLPIRDALRKLGFALGRGILSDKSVGLYRLSVSMSQTYPDMAKLFYESGPRMVQRAFADTLEREARAGRLRIKDPVRASEVFHILVAAHAHMAMALNVRSAPSDSELKKMVNEAVDVFLSAFGVDGSRA